MGCARNSKFIIASLEGKLLEASNNNDKMIIRNHDKIYVPEYLNQAFFTNALEEGLREALVHVHEISFEWGSNPGENYCSNIYRVLLTYDIGNANRLEKLSVILKTVPMSSETQFLNDIGVFIKEKIIYLDVLPKLEILSKGDKFGAKCLYSVKAPIQTLVFNDLKVDGFAVVNRENGLDWNHASLVVGQLAKFHATSMVLAQKVPSIKKRFQKGLFCTETALKNQTFQHIFRGFLEHLIRITSKWPGYQRISQHLKRYYEGFGEITATLAVPKPGDRIVVLNHGDMWTNNFMFAYEDLKVPKKPTKQIFVDFQVCFYGSPACDLNFFLSTSLSYETLVKQREDLIQHYYNIFRETLYYLRYGKIPSIDDLKYELRNREIYGLFGLFGYLPFVTMPKSLSEDCSIENYKDDEHHRKKLEAIFNNPNLQNHVKHGLRRLEEIGAFDDF